MAFNRFQHLSLGKYLGLWMDDPKRHAGIESNKFTAVDPQDSNAFNSNWNYNIKDNNYSPDNNTTISNAQWAVQDKQLFWAILDDWEPGIETVSMEAVARNSLFSGSKFYFKPTGTINGKSYYQICSSLKGHEFCVEMKSNGLGDYIVAMVHINLKINSDHNTYFSIEPAA